MSKQRVEMPSVGVCFRRVQRARGQHVTRAHGQMLSFITAIALVLPAVFGLWGSLYKFGKKSREFAVRGIKIFSFFISLPGYQQYILANRSHQFSPIPCAVLQIKTNCACSFDNGGLSCRAKLELKRRNVIRPRAFRRIYL
jgi:hypothetical protein